jgi:hypothetical protein
MDPTKVKFIEELIELRKQFEVLGGKITKYPEMIIQLILDFIKRNKMLLLI